MNSRRLRYASLFALLLALAMVLLPLIRLQLRAVSLLLRVQNPQDQSLLARFATCAEDEVLTTIPTPNGPVPARLYIPRGISNPPGMVVLHGVHHLGIEEPRMVNFSRALAHSGIEVLTPELQSLADYRVAPSDIPVIGAAAGALRQRTAGKPGVLGFSFAGGLALLAAARPPYADEIGYVVAIGAHDDLEMVSGYLATGQIRRPDGSLQLLPAHEYGILVLIYAHVDDYFAPADAATARRAIQLQLWEKVDQARALSAQLSPAGQTTMQLLLDHKDSVLASAVLAHLPQHAAEMAAVSPHGQLAGLHVPVLLLHGQGDNVIPATEALWLEQNVPAPYRRKLLVSPFISHVELKGKPRWRDKADIVEFMASMLGLAKP